ncbi:MAG: hypothetical protein ACLFNQ_07845 [Spirochaetaceae bacterium]
MACLRRSSLRGILVLITILFSACATTGPPGGQRERTPLTREERDVELPALDDREELSEDAVRDVFDVERLGRFEVAVIRAPEFRDQRTIELDTFARTELFIQVAYTLDLIEHLSEDELEVLFDAVTAPVPRGLQGVDRAVLVGQFFDDGTPLYILIGSYDDPSAGRGSRRVLLQSNAFPGRDGRAATVSGSFIDITTNISWDLLISDDGSLAVTRIVEERRRAEETDGSSPETGRNSRTSVSRSRDFLFDGNQESFAEIPALLEPVWNDPREPVDLRYSAGVLLMKYSLARGAYRDAVEYRDAVIRLATRVENSELRRSSETVVPLYFEIFQRLSRP